MSTRTIAYNLGCGSNKLPGCINVDINPENNPDIVADFRQPFPSDFEPADRVFLFHTIEHIEAKHHLSVYLQAHRLLKSGGLFVLSYPEFAICADRFIKNYKGQRDFYRATLYGRQLFPADYHVTPMDTQEVVASLLACGFTSIEVKQEPVPNEFNTIVKCVKGEMMTAESLFLKNTQC